MPSGSALATSLALVRTAEISLPTFFEGIFGLIKSERIDRRLRHWSTALLRLADVRLSVAGLDALPDRACVYMSNHQSHFDIPILYSVFPGRLRMVAKAALFRVPIWGRALHHAGFVRVVRSGDRKEALLAMRQCAEVLASGTSIWIAPEGTRSPDGQLGRFKKGGFYLAQTTGAAIVPVAIDGSLAILSKRQILVRRGAVVRLSFGQPIVPDEKSLPALMGEVEAAIRSLLRAPAVAAP